MIEWYSRHELIYANNTILYTKPWKQFYDRCERTKNWVRDRYHKKCYNSGYRVQSISRLIIRSKLSFMSAISGV